MKPTPVTTATTPESGGQRQRRCNVTRILLLLLLSGCSTLDFDRPSTWVEATAPDVYFIADLPPNTVSASAFFATAPLDRDRLPSDFTIHLASFRVIGDSHYADTLDYLDLRDPVDEDDHVWRWSGTIVFPPFFGQPSTEPSRLGVQIRGMPYAATRSVPLSHRYCTIDLLGAGVLDCEPWADAFFHSKIICRGKVGQIIDCHGIGYELVPLIGIGGIMGGVSGVAPMAEREFVILGGVTFVHDPDGWRYKRADCDERGPFAAPEDAARDAAERLPWAEGVPGTLADLFPTESQQRLVRALCRETARTAKACVPGEATRPSPQ